MKLNEISNGKYLDATRDIAKVLGINSSDFVGNSWCDIHNGYPDSMLTIAVPNNQVDPEDIELTKRAVLITLKKYFSEVQARRINIFTDVTQLHFRVTP